MSEWKKVKLGEISSAIQTGPFGSQLHQSDYSDIGVPVVMPKDIINGCIDESTIARVENHHVERLSRHKISEGDILYARRGDVGKCAYTVFEQQGWLCGTGCLRVTIDKEKALPKFVFFQLQKRETIGWVEKHAIGATMLNLNTSILSDVPIVLPSLSIQQRIATILSRYDFLIENYQKQIKLLEEAAQRLYKEWFVDLRFPGYENTKIVDGVPEGWEKKKISEVCDTIGGGTPSTKVLSYYENGTISWVTPTDITKNNSLCLLSTEKKITKEGLDHSSAKMLPAETILMTSRASVGFFGICDFEVCTNQGFISCVPFDNNFQMYLLYNLMNRVEEIRIKAGGSTYLEISKSVFRNFDIICPKDDLICLFQKEAHQLLERMRMICKQIHLLTEARDRLLPKLMSGEIEV
jgi:type I restriction enzyme S subunit